MASRTRAAGSEPLDGEDLATSHWEDARHWMSIYDDLIRFKRGLLARVEKDLATLSPVARKAAAEDLTIIEDQLEGYQSRLDLWYRRVWELQGLWLDAESQMVRHQGTEAHLTKREFQLLQFLLDHPHRYFTADQIEDRAWAEPSLHPEEVRNYIRRIRTILSKLEIPCDLLNRPYKGYSLVFHNQP
jgi:DNA-binding response OmpR family regulator